MKKNKDNNTIRTVLHVGCGPRKSGKIHTLFQNNDWKEIRLDIDPDVNPDIVASITRMDSVHDHSMDAVYSSHNLEHLFSHEVPICLKEFLRVLKPEGFALIAVPNLKKVAEFIAADQLDKPVYNSPAGPIYPIDIFYGHSPAIAAGRIHMAHKTGFTPTSLSKAVVETGFAWAKFAEDTSFGLWIKAYKNMPSQEIANQPLW